MIPEPLRLAIRRAVQGEVPWPLFVHGPAGTGKTSAALCLLDFARGEYFTATGLAEYLIQAQQGKLSWWCEGQGGTIWPEDVWQRLSEQPLIVLDELGSRQTVSDHHYDCVKRLLEDRHSRPFLILSNLDLDAISRLYDDRIASRLGEGTVVALGGEDRRLAR